MNSGNGYAMPPPSTSTAAKRVAADLTQQIHDNHKRPKRDMNDNIVADNHLINTNFGFDRNLTLVTNSLNNLTTNGHQLDDHFGDGLSDDELNDVLSQVAEHHQPVHQIHQIRFHSTTAAANGRNPSQLSTQFIRMADQVMSTDETQNNGSSGQTNGHNNGGGIASAEANEGRIKILESRNQKLSEELANYKSQVIQTKRQVVDVRTEYKQQIGDINRKHESEMLFTKSELQLCQQMNEKLQTFIDSKSFADGNKVEFVSNFLKNRNHSQTFSQLKMQEFYGPLPTQPLSTQQMSGSAIGSTPDRNVFKTPNSIRMSQSYLSSTPTEIPATQSPYRMSQPMASSTQCSQPTRMETNSADTSAQSTQSLTQSLFEPIRLDMESKFNANRDLLSEYFLDQQIGLFSDQWIRSPQELNDWSQSLNDLSKQLEIKFIVNF